MKLKFKTIKNGPATIVFVKGTYKDPLLGDCVLLTAKGVAKLGEGDEYDQKFGESLAKSRALAKFYDKSLKIHRGWSDKINRILVGKGSTLKLGLEKALSEIPEGYRKY